MKILSQAQQEQVIRELNEVLERNGITSFYCVAEIKDPAKPAADFCAVLSGGKKPTPMLGHLCQQTFAVIRSLSRVDLSQVKDN